MTKRGALELLKQHAQHLEDISYEEIVDLLRKDIRRIPIPLTRMKAASLIDRARLNRGEELFRRVADLRYITDGHVISDYLTEFGRGSIPHGPMFYGALESSQIRHQRITAIAETSLLFQNDEAVNVEGELYTVSRWHNTEELFLAEMVFATEAMAVNPDIERAFVAQGRFARQNGADDVEFYMDFLRFISDQFARTAHSHHDYKISAAYTQLILLKEGVHGVAYPSVQTRFAGQNIVLPPSTVDRFLLLDSVITQRLHKQLKKSFFNNHRQVTDPLAFPDELHWQELEQAHIATAEDIRQALE